MSATTSIQIKLTRFALVVLAAAACALPVRAQYVSTVVSNLSQPAGVAVDANNNVYLTDPGNNRIVEFVPSGGGLTELAGTAGNWGADDGAGSAASFAYPQGIVAAWGGLVVVDQGSSLIRLVTFDGTVTTLAGQAFLPGTNNGVGTNALFSYPLGIAVDSANNLYVADSQNGSIRKIDPNSKVSTLATGFNLPSAVAVDNYNNVWVADSVNNVISVISNGVVTVVAGAIGQAGTNDSMKAANARFNSPGGLLWLPGSSSLYISDTGNGTVRNLFVTNFNGSIGYAVRTVAGIPGKHGFVNGSLSVAQFASPVGLCADPTDFGYYVVDSVNNALRVLQATAPLPPVDAPVLGYVTFPAGANPPYSSVFVQSASAVFNNLVDIAIEADAGTQTYYSYGPTGSSIPPPGPATGNPAIYPGNGTAEPDISSIISPGPGTNDITIYAIGIQFGRQSSPVVSARYQFVTANPSIGGNNAADILVSDITGGANMFYTIDNSTPTNDGSSLGAVGSGSIISLIITNDVLLKVRAFANGLAPSQVMSNELLLTNLVGNQMSWGYSGGPASTHFITAKNLLFTAPVTFTELPSSLPIYAMQLDLTVINNGTNPAPVLAPDNFITDGVTGLLQPVLGEPNTYIPIPPGIFYWVGTNGVTNSGILTKQPNSLELAWLVTPPVSNLYSSDNLLEFSCAAQLLFVLPNLGQTVLGRFQFVIPATAETGNPYELQIQFPTASSYVDPKVGGPPINVFVQAPTNGPTNGLALNALKSITVLSNNDPASAHLVGDIFPYTWYNIGDFGDGVLENDDVIETMEYMGFGNFANNPFYDAMDSSDGTINNYYTASDAAIDAITTGDGVISVDDVYVTLRRSLDPGLVNYSRYWSGTSWVPTVYGSPVQPRVVASPAKSMATNLAVSAPHSIAIAADQIHTGGGLTAQVPIRVLAADSLSVRVFMLNVEIDPLDGSPPINSAVTFTAVTNLGSPYATVSKYINNYAAGWLDSAVSGVSGTNIIGTLTVTLPPNVNSKSAYRVHFNHFSASPNGLALFHSTIQDGLITVGDRTGSSWRDGIPDTWRLLHFGTVSNSLSAANADPDGDGANNWQEYVAGTDPLDGASVFEFSPAAAPSGSGLTLQWPSVVNKVYSVQSASSLGGVWTTVATNLVGNGQTMNWTDSNASGSGRFYRAMVQ